MARIDETYTKHPFYGVRKITREFDGVNHKRVYRLMGLIGIQAIYPKPNLSKPDKYHQVYPYLLRGLAIEKPNQVWGTDITYIKMHNDWLYLVAIIDWYSRYVLAWELSDNLSVDFCLEALRKALTLGIPEIHNSDQGVQFTSEEYLKILKQYDQIQISMDSRGRAFDNIFNERLWRTVKYEEVYLKDYRSFKEAKYSLKEYFEFYDQERFHQSLNYQTPAQVYFKN